MMDIRIALFKITLFSIYTNLPAMLKDLNVSLKETCEKKFPLSPSHYI